MHCPGHRLAFPQRAKEKTEGVAAARGSPMTDLARFGLALVGVTVAVIVGGVVLGLIGARLNCDRR